MSSDAADVLVIRSSGYLTRELTEIQGKRLTCGTEKLVLDVQHDHDSQILQDLIINMIIHSSSSLNLIFQHQETV